MIKFKLIISAPLNNLHTPQAPSSSDTHRSNYEASKQSTSSQNPFHFPRLFQYIFCLNQINQSLIRPTILQIGPCMAVQLNHFGGKTCRGGFVMQIYILVKKNSKSFYVRVTWLRSCFRGLSLRWID